MNRLPPDQLAHQAADGRVVRRARRASRNRDSASPASGSPRRRRGSCLARWEACWCAACARGGTGRSWPGQGQAAQSPMAKMSSSRVVCSVRAHHQLVEPVGLQPADVGQHVRRLDAGRPHHQLGRDDAPLASRTPLASTSATRRAGMHAHAEPFEQLCRRLRQPLGQRRQDARRRLDQVDLDVLVGVDAVEPEGDELARGLVQLGRQLGARRARRR